MGLFDVLGQVFVLLLLTRANDGEHIVGDLASDLYSVNTHGAETPASQAEANTHRQKMLEVGLSLDHTGNKPNVESAPASSLKNSGIPLDPPVVSLLKMKHALVGEDSMATGANAMGDASFYGYARFLPGTPIEARGSELAKRESETASAILNPSEGQDEAFEKASPDSNVQAGASESKGNRDDNQEASDEAQTYGAEGPLLSNAGDKESQPDPGLTKLAVPVDTEGDSERPPVEFKKGETKKTKKVKIIDPVVAAIPGVQLSASEEEDESEDHDEVVQGDEVVGTMETKFQTPTGKRPVVTKVIGFEMLDEQFGCSENRGPLKHMTNGSKYFADGGGMYTYKQAKAICQEYGLVIAELDEVADHRSLQKFVAINTDAGARASKTKNRYFIGTNDIKTEGIFKRGDGKPLVYQNFHASQPDDKNQSEDCVTLMKEQTNGPVGSADDNCDIPAHVLCMFRVNSQCYNESKETVENWKVAAQRGITVVVNASERAYMVSNFQATWKDAMHYCSDRKMQLFSMDHVVTMGFFKNLLRKQNDFVQAPTPTIQYWTSGKFKSSHMTAPIIWHTKAEPTASEERGVQKHNATFSWSGLYHWSVKKLRDPGGPYGYRRDICVSFGFDGAPDPGPYIRNTNCEMPCYFVCYEMYDPEPDLDD